MDANQEIPLGRLLANLGRLQATRVDQLMEQIGLYRGQGMLLMTLSHQDGLTHSEIAERLQISPSAATKVIKRLESLQYLKRQPDPSDERISRVYLQPAGWAVIDKIHAAFKRINVVISAGFSQQEKEQLRSLIGRIHANLEKADFG
jgi:DNA-binding MarR family transcriptional regulator